MNKKTRLASYRVPSQHYSNNSNFAVDELAILREKMQRIERIIDSLLSILNFEVEEKGTILILTPKEKDYTHSS